MISELKRAFEIGFMLFLPFLIIDLVVASVLMSMGMMMLPSATISLPFADLLRASGRMATRGWLPRRELPARARRLDFQKTTTMTVFVLGSINLDAVARVDGLPRPGETVAGLSLALFLGGKGANQAVAAARMGAPTRLMGAVGGDDSGKGLKAKLAGYSVQVADVLELEGVPTGQAHVWVANNAENMIVVTAGANAMVTPQQVSATPIEGQRVLLCQLETPPAAVEALFRAGAAKGSCGF
jgi:hypothetical protein